MEYDNLSANELRILYEQAMKNEIISKYTIPSKPSKDGYFRVWVADSTKKTGRRQITAKTLEELENKLYAIEKGRYGSARKTFKECFYILQESKMQYIKKQADIESTKSTIKRNKADFRRFIEGTALENMYVDEVTKKDLEANILFNCQRYDLIKSSFNAMKTILSSTMRFAFTEEWIESNPYERLDFRQYKRLYDDGADTIDRMFDDIQIQKILRELEKIHSEHPAQMTAWCAHLEMLVGFRPGEAPPLLWEDIHGNYFKVCKEQIKTVSGAHMGVNHTKTRYNRRMPLTPRGKALLERIKAVQSVYFPDTPFLFPNTDGTDCVKKNAVYKVLQRICDRCEISLSTNARKGTSAFRKRQSTMLQKATSAELESRINGHSPDVAKRHYLGDDGVNMEEAVRVLDALGY